MSRYDHDPMVILRDRVQRVIGPRNGSNCWVSKVANLRKNGDRDGGAQGGLSWGMGRLLIVEQAQ